MVSLCLGKKGVKPPPFCPLSGAENPPRNTAAGPPFYRDFYCFLQNRNLNKGGVFPGNVCGNEENSV